MSYLHCCALIREGAVKEGVDDGHDTVGDVVLHGDVGMFAVVSDVRHHAHVHQEALLKQTPHVVRCVDLLHLHFRVDVTVIQEVGICFFHLNYV